MYNPVQQAYSANIDDRALHELYLWPFADGVKAGVGSIMASYNAVCFLPKMTQGGHY